MDACVLRLLACLQPLSGARTLEPMPTFGRQDGLEMSPTGLAPKLGAKPLLPSKSPVSSVPTSDAQQLGSWQEE